MDRDLDSTLVADLKQIKLDMEELKQTQFLGANNLKIYLMQSTAGYDYSVTIPAFSRQVVYLEYSSINQPYPFYDPRGKLFVDSPTTPDTNNSLQISDDVLFGVPYRVKMPYTISNNTASSHTYYLKFYLKASDAVDTLSYST